MDEKTYIAALAKMLEDLVCSGDDAAIQIVRGPGWRGRIELIGDAAFGLIDHLTNKDGKDCPVAAVLTNSDRASLLSIKHAIEVGR